MSRPLADAAHHRDAVERVLDTEGVVVDVRVLRSDVLVRVSVRVRVRASVRASVRA